MPTPPPLRVGGRNACYLAASGCDLSALQRLLKAMTMWTWEPDNPMAITELVAHLTETSTNTLRQVDVLRINLQRQQFDVTRRSNVLPGYQAIHAMECTLSLQSVQDMMHLEQVLPLKVDCARARSSPPITQGTVRIGLQSSLTCLNNKTP
eukprot:1557408-Amphidinium_carterae.1